MDPVGGALPVEKALVVGGFGNQAAADDRLALTTFGACPFHTITLARISKKS